MKLFFLIIFLLTPMISYGQVVIGKIQFNRQVVGNGEDFSEFIETRRVMILSASKDKIIAFGVVRTIHLDEKMIKINIEEVIDNNIVMVGDRIFPLDFKTFKEKNIPGFVSLTLSGSEKIPAKYKELVYFGVFTSEGHSLDRDEFMVSLFQTQYGVTNNLGVKIVNPLLLDGYINMGIKYQVMKNKYAKLTVNTLGAYKVQDQDWIGQFGGVFSTPKNAKYQNHLMATFTIDPQYDRANASKGLNLFQDSDIRNITEYVTDSWNRVLFGPVYNVELQTFGGTISYLWIWDSFHMSLGLGTRDITELKFSSNGYYTVYDFFWRF